MAFEVLIWGDSIFATGIFCVKDASQHLSSGCIHLIPWRQTLALKNLRLP